MSIERTLDRWTQAALAPGAAAYLAGRTGALLADLGIDGPLLDVGCGYSSPLSALGRPFTAVDIDAARAGSHGVQAVAADADALPFSNDTFTAAFSFGLLHHLDDGSARRAIAEMCRVAQPGALIAIFDGVRSESGFRPAASLIRTLDRGSNMRSEALLRALFAEADAWSFERVTYAATGLEGLWCIRCTHDREQG